MIPARITSSAPLKVGTRRLRRQYVDAQGAPLAGTMTLTGTQTHRAGEQVVLPSSFDVELVNGWLDVRLPPGEYRASAALTTSSGESVRPQTETFRLT